VKLTTGAIVPVAVLSAGEYDLSARKIRRFAPFAAYPHRVMPHDILPATSQ
jgi:hypothetical protein